MCEKDIDGVRTLCESLHVAASDDQHQTEPTTMKTSTRTTEVSITLNHDPKLPHVLSIDGPKGFAGDDIYFSEHDGSKISDLAPAFLDQLPKGAKIESNNRDEAWVSHWDDEALAALDGRTFRIRFVQTFEVDEDGDTNWIEDSATLVA